MSEPAPSPTPTAARAALARRASRPDRRGGARRAAALLAAVLVAGAAGPAPAGGTLDAATAVNTAGRQRMLSQRIVKAYCLTGLGVLGPGARRQLDEAVATFRRQLDWLSSLPVDSAAGDALERVRSVWRAVEPIVTGRVERARAAELARRSDALLEAAHRFVTALETASGTAIARLVNLAGRQRMLSQRLAKLYCLRAWGLDDPALGSEMERARAQFAAALATLSAAPENHTEILDELAAVNLQWTWFDYALGLPPERSYLLVVEDSSEAILEGLERITGLYAALPAR